MEKRLYSGSDHQEIAPGHEEIRPTVLDVVIDRISREVELLQGLQSEGLRLQSHGERAIFDKAMERLGEIIDEYSRTVQFGRLVREGLTGKADLDFISKEEVEWYGSMLLQPADEVDNDLREPDEENFHVLTLPLIGLQVRAEMYEEMARSIWVEDIEPDLESGSATLEAIADTMRLDLKLLEDYRAGRVSRIDLDTLGKVKEYFWARAFGINPKETREPTEDSSS